MNATLTLIVYCLFILLASLAGGWVPLMFRLTHERMQVAISFVAGAMLGIGLLHLLPHALHEIDSVDLSVRWLIAGFLLMFFVERFFHFHHHDVAADEHDDGPGHEHSHRTLESTAPSGPAGSPIAPAAAGAARLSWAGAAIGLALHSMIDGVAVAASVTAESAGGVAPVAGLGTFLVVFLHKPFDAMTVGALLAAGGWSVGWRHAANALLALAIPVGAAFFFLGLGQSPHGNSFLGACLAFAAGSFLCISTSDLLPELQFHQHDRIKLSLALMAGLLMAWAIGLVESSGHEHLHSLPPL